LREGVTAGCVEVDSAPGGVVVVVSSTLATVVVVDVESPIALVIEDPPASDMTITEATSATLRPDRPSLSAAFTADFGAIAGFPPPIR
jgi:hypothetical protein